MTTATPLSLDDASIIDLSDLLLRHNSALDSALQQLEEKGWALIRLDDSTLVKTIQAAIEPLQKFFALSKEEKDKYHVPPVWGYSSVNHKESFRVMTSARWAENQLPESHSLYFPLYALANKLDSIMVTLAAATAKRWFNSDMNKLASKLDLPLLKQINLGLTGNDNTKPFGMLDVVNYFNESPLPIQVKDEPPINCAPHYDPGLLSLSFLSTTPGLELFNPQINQWFAPPSLEAGKGAQEIAVLWAGEAAKIANDKIQPAVHRVVFPPSLPAPPRMAIWFELCTASQEPPMPASTTTPTTTTDKKKKKGFFSKKEKKEKTTNNKKKNSNSRGLGDNVVGDYKLSPNEEEGLKEYTLRLEKVRGIPPTKSRAPTPKLKLASPAKTETTVRKDYALEKKEDESGLEFASRMELDLGLPMSKSGIEFRQFIHDDPPVLPPTPPSPPNNNNSFNSNSNNNNSTTVLGDYKLEKKGKESGLEFAKRLEFKRGLPISKSGIDFRSFDFPPNNNNNSNI